MKKKHLVQALKDGLLLKRLRDGENVVEAINKRLPEGYAIVSTASTEDLTDWRNWRVGDVVECVEPEQWPILVSDGRILTITRNDCGNISINGTRIHVGHDSFRFHSRPSLARAEDRGIKTWRVGDWVECIDVSSEKLGRLHDISVGDVRQITETSTRKPTKTAMVSTGQSAWGDESNYRLVRRADEPAPVANVDEIKEGDVIEITQDLNGWWKAGNKHPVFMINGNLGVYDLYGGFRKFPLAVCHHKVQS